MDLRLKYTGGTFEINETFLEALEEITDDIAEDILIQLAKLSTRLKNKYKEIQEFAGVSHVHGQFFFSVSVVKERNKYPYFMSIDEISSDEYLDYRINEKSI